MAPAHDPMASLEALLAAAARGEPVSGDVVRFLRPDGVMGALVQMPLTEVLQNMDFAKKSGRVDVWLEGVQGTVRVHDGQIVHAVATTHEGTVEGETAVLELCREADGYFSIRYVRDDVDQNVHRPTTFVLLEALRVIDEARARAVPAAIDLGGGGPPLDVGAIDVAVRDVFPPFLQEDDQASPWDEPSASLDIEVATAEPLEDFDAGPDKSLVDLIAESELLVAAGDLDRARRVLSRAQGLAPENDDVRRRLLRVKESIDAAHANALIEQAMRGGPRAVELARRATQLRPVRDVLLRSLAVFARGGAHDEVADVAEQLLELDPDDVGALRTLLDANVAMKRWAVALRAAEALLKARPQDEQLRATYQRVLELSGRT